MANYRGIGGNRTSFNEKEEIRAKVIGVLNYNNDIRDEILNKNLGSYVLYQNEEGPKVGAIYDVYGREENRYTPIGDKGLFGYTHNTKVKDGPTNYTAKSLFAIDINNKYGFNEDELIAYEVLNPNPALMKKWGGKYENYLDYINYAYGNTPKLLEAVYSVLGENDIKYHMMQDRVGVIRNINVFNSLNGIVMTNPNKGLMPDTNEIIDYVTGTEENGLFDRGVLKTLAGRDTTLGKFSNRRYAILLSNAAYFNTLRNTPYITPQLANVYGNNMNNNYKLADMFYIKESTGRLVGSIGDGGFEDNFIEDLHELYGGISAFAEDLDENPHNNDFIRLENIKRNYEEFFNGRKDIRFQTKYTAFEPYAVINKDKGLKIGPTISLDGGVEVNVNSYEKNITKYKEESANINIHIYSEGDTKNSGINSKEAIEKKTFNNENYQIIDIKQNGGLLSKTAKLFDEHKIGTLVARFHTEQNQNESKLSTLQTAVSKYGLSHGRNLLTENASIGSSGKNINGYDNPYCRVWTYHHQYATVENLIRPFAEYDDSTNKKNAKNIGVVQNELNKYTRAKGEYGAKRLGEHTVLGNFGFINISPSEVDKIDIKKYMFSIENLAWKDVNVNNSNNISKEQVGPLGGRIMWFPPYNIQFSENINVNWNSNDFIGRGEKIYTYTNTERGGTLSFTLLIDHPSVLNYIDKDVKDDDILRFFAGCNTLSVKNFKDKQVEEIENKNKQENTPSIEPRLAIPTGNTNNVIFYIFFPNNYTGAYDAGGDYEAQGVYQNKEVDPMTYLYCGTGVQEKGRLNFPTIEDITNGRGYEMSEKGISTTADDDYILGNTDDKKWLYRIDLDKDKTYVNEKLKNTGSYNDDKGYSLNYNYNLIIRNDMFKDATHSFAEFYQAALYGKVDSIIPEEEALNLYEILKNNEIEKISIKGAASEHGNEKKNKKLSKDRASTVKNWLANKQISTAEKIKIDDAIIVDTTDVSATGKTAKMGRYVRVEIFFKDSEIKQMNGGVTTDETTKNDSGTNIRVERTISDEIPQRYENEAQYFHKIREIGDPLIRNLIKEKVKYFDPAFHSISPEGFNARLTFLQQCTRQGNTNEVRKTADGKEHYTSGNLAFGRPPVCVLRIGDFYNTRIIIHSMGIDYETMQWDLNPEGVGVQPMLANVNLSFTFIGGSELGGPISRLQNAVSFNYYANTSAYDDRADTISYDDNRDGIYQKELVMIE